MKKKTIGLIIFFVIIIIFFLLTMNLGGSADNSSALQINSVVYADDGSLDVVWDFAEDAAGYEIYRADTEDGEFVMIGSADSETFVFNDADVEDYKTYYYQVKGLKSKGAPAVSETVHGFTQGKLLYDSELSFVLKLENKDIPMETNSDIGLGCESLDLVVMKNGTAVTDYKLYCDEELLSPVKKSDGTTTIRHTGMGNHIITAQVGDSIGSIKICFDYGVESDVILVSNVNSYKAWDIRLIEPRLQKTCYAVFNEDGTKIEDYSVTSSDSRICSVEQEHGNFTLSNNAPGKCYLTIETGKSKTDFEILVHRGLATDELYFVNGIAAGSSIESDQDKQVIADFIQPELTRAEIKEMLATDLSLEEAAEKITTVQDAVNYMYDRGYYIDYSYNPYMEYNGYGWGWNLSADFTYEHNAGVCGGISNLMNRLLKGDYDSQGYVQVDGHVYNYFYNDEVYFYCDFADLSLFPPRSYKDDTDYLVPLYIIFAAKEPDEYGEYAVKIRPDYKNPYSDDYMPYIYSYPLDGENLMPRGDSEAHETADGIVHLMTLPDAMEDTVEFIYLAEDRKIRFMKAPTPDMYPPEINIPKD